MSSPVKELFSSFKDITVVNLGMKYTPIWDFLEVKITGRKREERWSHF
jgi:hypothetical protein